MNRTNAPSPRPRHGAALLVTLIFLAIFASLAVAIAVASGANLTVSRNRLEISQAQNLVETGLCMVQREITAAQVTGQDAAALHASLAEHFAMAWDNVPMANGQIEADSSGVAFPAITAPGPNEQSGTIILSVEADGGVGDATTITLAATGRFGDATRTAYYDFNIRSGYGFFTDYGIASQAPVVLRGNARLDGANNASEASVYSSSSSSGAVDVRGRGRITGDAVVSTDGAGIITRGRGTIDGEQVIGGDEQEWPDIDPSVFEQYVQSTYSGRRRIEDATLSNVRIPAGTNPVFQGNTNLYGVVYIESPNKVTFKDNTNICGVVVCEEPTVENYGSNRIQFNGNLSAAGVEYLPNLPQYDGLRDLTGTFLLAPGFDALFNRNFGTLNGYVAAGRIRFTGNASGTVRGGMLVTDDTQFRMSGNAHLTVDKDNAADHPAGFSQKYSLVCVTGSYRE